MSTKELNLIDLNLLSGSSDTFRMALGSYYEILSGTTGEYLNWVYYKDGSWCQEYVINDVSEGFGYWSIGVTYPETILTRSSDVIIPNKSYPYRLRGQVDKIKDDDFWKGIFTGGSWGTSSFPAVFTDAVFDDHSFKYSLPYSQQEAVNIYGGTEFADVYQVTYEYNRYLKEYQDYIAKLDSELLIPNIYLLKSYDSFIADSTEVDLGDLVVNFITRENNVLTADDDYTYFDFPTTDFDSNNALDWNSLLLKNDFASEYLTSSLLLYPLSASTSTEIKSKFQNIMFDYDVLDSDSTTSPYISLDAYLDSGGIESDDSHTLTYKSKIPYYTTINFNTARSDETSFIESIEDNNFSQKFLKTLKETFLDETTLTSDEKTFATEAAYLSASADSGSVQYYDVTTINNVSYRSVDYLKMLTYAYNNFTSTTTNCYFVGGETFNRKAVFDSIGVYRHSNVRSSLAVINDAVGWVSDEGNYNIDSMCALYNDSQHDSREPFAPKYYETLAYRVEKVGGAATGDSQTQNVLQNFWFFNRSDIEEINLCDSQVKYGAPYTYNVYAYVLTIGAKYSISDLRLTRHIGAVEDSTKNCLEYYDPETGDAVDQLAPWESNPLSGSTTYASNAQVTTAYDYMADYYINQEPNLKLVEIPMFSKTLTVQDHPPNTFDINPYQVKDNSQTIGFLVNYETFYFVGDDVAGTTYPTPISPADDSVRSDYLNSRDLLSGSYMDLESISRQRYFEVYRLDKKPVSIRDFDGNKIRTIDLNISSTKYTYSSTDFRDRIKTNQKYYYLFRFVNEQRIPGQLSEIYETELVDDGGYKYAVFNVIFESELGEEVFVNPSKPFKKLIQLQPNISHLLLDTSAADFEGLAIDEAANIAVGSAEDPIWNQTFKLRLTSKKTGKKIDFNITYKVDNQFETS